MSPAEETQNPTEGEGLSLQEKEHFILGTLPRLAEATFPFICGVYGVSNPATGRQVGTGLRCMLNGRRALLTAHHVMLAAKTEPLGVAISIGYGKPPYLVHGPVNSDPVADLAVFFLPDDYPGEDSTFWPATRIDRSLDKLSTDYLFLHGFPGQNSYSSQHLGGVLTRSLPYGAMQRLDNLPSDLQSYQFAVEYDPDGTKNDTGTPQDLVDPHGLSGSPVWRIGISGRRSSEWAVDDSLLVGILTQWRPSEKVLVATSTAKLPQSW